jgi:hypothetical protein
MIKELVSLQRSFLLNGGGDGKKICCVSWEHICQSKDKGGLGIKNIALFNKSLLCKWKWRCLNDKDAPWYDFLSFRCRSFAANFLYGEGRIGLKTSSIWWRDVWNLGGVEEEGWFASNVSNVLADGKEFSFWKEKWLGMESFLVTFPNLFSKAYRPNGVVEEMGISDSNGWLWRLLWNELLSASETVDERHLLDILLQVQPCHATMDRRKWTLAPDGVFTVKSTYLWLQNQVVVTGIDALKVTALKK